MLKLVTIGKTCCTLRLLLLFLHPKNQSIHKMKKYLHYLTAIVVACLLLASCDDNKGNQTITEQTLPNCFASVADIADGPAAYYSGLAYKVRRNYTEPSAEVTVSGLKLTDGTSYPSFTLSGLKFSIDKDGWIVLSGENLTPSGVSSSLLVSRFSMRLYQRIVGNVYSPAFSVGMTIDGRYSVASAYASQGCFGTTTSTSESFATFQTKDTQYALAFNIETRCVTISIVKAQFMEKMPAMDIVLKNIPFTMRGTTAYFEIDNIVPESNDTPYPAFRISNLKGELDFGAGLDLDFDCAPEMFGGAVFHISADCGFVPAS